MMLPPSPTRSAFVFLVALLSCHRSRAWRTRRGFRARSSSLENSIIPRRSSPVVVLRLRGGGGDDDGDCGDDDGKELYDSNTSGFGSMITTGGFLSHVFVMSRDDCIDTDIRVMKKYLKPSTKCNIISDAFSDKLRHIDFVEDEDAEAYLRKMIVCARVVDKPLHLCGREKRDDYCKLIGIKEVESDGGRSYTIYCLTVLDSFGDREKKLLDDLKELVGSEWGYVGHMLSPPPSTAEEFMANMEEAQQESSSNNQLNEKIGFFAGQEMSVKQWITTLHQTGGNLVSKPELQKFVIFGGIGNIKETFVGDADHQKKEIKVTPDFLKTFFQGEIWEYPNWEFYATRDYLFVQFGEDRGVVLQWKEPLEINPESLASDGMRGMVHVIENDGETFFQKTSE